MTERRCDCGFCGEKNVLYWEHVCEKFKANSPKLIVDTFVLDEDKPEAKCKTAVSSGAQN